MQEISLSSFVYSSWEIAAYQKLGRLATVGTDTSEAALHR
jgi:hypothetical protein